MTLFTVQDKIKIQEYIRKMALKDELLREYLRQTQIIIGRGWTIMKGQAPAQHVPQTDRK